MMPDPTERPASRAGDKLRAALQEFAVDVTARVCADLGSNAGGFVQCLLDAGAAKVYAVERGYGVLDSRLRNDPRVVVRERTDALKVFLPEPIDLVSIDVGWTRQKLILPAAGALLAPHGEIISLIKPHYESQPDQLSDGVLDESLHPALLESVRGDVTASGFEIVNEMRSPVIGGGGNVEYLWRVRPVRRS